MSSLKYTYHSKGRIKMLKERTTRCVCKYCGNRLRLKQLNFSDVDEARVEIFCNNCDRIEFGVEREIYESAKYFVEQTGFNYYQDLDDTEKTKRMNISKVCDIMAWQDKMLGFIDKNGFVYPIKKTFYMDECLHVTDEMLNNDEIEVVDVGVVKA